MKMKITAKMIRLIFTIFCTATLACNSAYAETTKSAKKPKFTDTNQTMSDEEFMKQFMALDKEEKDAKSKTSALERKSKALDKLEKTVDELSNKIGLKQ